MIYIYPAVFTPAKEGGYSIYFPDLPGANSEGDSLTEALAMAKKALASWLDYLLDERIELPKATIPFDKPLEKGEFSTLIDVDMTAYRRKKESRAVKKTVTLPSWLNEEAEAAKLNFSAILQDGIKEHLRINQ
jgi:predicted RNase H-like HicB family nuclease